MNTVICSITREQKAEDTLLAKSLSPIGDIEIHIETNNSGKNVKGLSQFYNECLENFKDRDNLVFVHDDVELKFSDLTYQVTTALEKFDVAGVAGCINPKVIDKNLWHWMAGVHGNMRGFAGHSKDSNEFVVTSYGPTPARVILLDGVFLAVNVKKLRDSGVKFDEQFKFHHYDIDFGLTCNKNKLKLGVWPFIINHRSPGLANFHEDWVKSNELFINKWKKI
jgi:hypothetical protein